MVSLDDEVPTGPGRTPSEKRPCSSPFPSRDFDRSPGWGRTPTLWGATPEHFGMMSEHSHDHLLVVASAVRPRPTPTRFFQRLEEVQDEDAFTAAPEETASSSMPVMYVPMQLTTPMCGAPAPRPLATFPDPVEQELQRQRLHMHRLQGHAGLSTQAFGFAGLGPPCGTPSLAPLLAGPPSRTVLQLAPLLAEQDDGSALGRRARRRKVSTEASRGAAEPHSIQEDNHTTCMPTAAFVDLGCLVKSTRGRRGAAPGGA